MSLNVNYLISRYLEPLAIALDKERWSLVQLLMSSSYCGYGISTLEQVRRDCLPVSLYGNRKRYLKIVTLRLLNLFCYVILAGIIV